MSNTAKFIENIYAEFKEEEWTENNYPNLFKRMREMSANRSVYPHDLGHFAIFYTQVPQAPVKYMIIGNNPSWFHKDAKNSAFYADEALRIIQSLEHSPPSSNLYLTGKFAFADQMQEVFGEYHDELSKAVGLNRLWVQTGTDLQSFKASLDLYDGRADSQNLDEFLKYESPFQEFKRVQKYCEQKSIEIVQHLQPEILFLFGAEAQKTFENANITSQKVNARHPARGGVGLATTQVQSALRKFLGKR